MQNSYIPKIDEKHYCQGLDLCSVRKTNSGITKVGIKMLDGTLKEDLLENVINADIYNGKKIVRVYSSGHIFLSPDFQKVFLVTTQKDGKIQHQFTGGSPLEDENKDVIIEENGVYKFNLVKVLDNAIKRTKARTGVLVTQNYNSKPLVDWAFMENIDENGEVYFKLVCLMHFIVAQYDGNLGYTNNEYVTDGKWYNIDDLPNTPNIAPNAYVVSNKAREKMMNDDY